MRPKIKEWVVLFFASLCGTAGNLIADDSLAHWQADRSQVLMSEGKVAEVILSGNILLETFQEIITADEAHFFPDRQEALLSGKVCFTSPLGKVETDTAFINITTGVGFTGPASFSYPPWYGRVERIELQGWDKALFLDGYITTCDHKPPHYQLRFNSAQYEKGQKVKMKPAVFRVGSVPICWLPAVSQSADKNNPFIFSFDPKYSSENGLQFLSRTAYTTPEERWSMNLDFRGESGFGFGPEYQSNRKGETEIKTYYIYDLERDENRYRLEASHRAYFLRERGEDALLLEFHQFSDPDFRKDFFWRESINDADAESFFFLSANREDYYLSLLASGQVDDYHNLTRYLPEAHLFVPYRQAGSLWWQEDLKVDNLSRKFPEGRIETERLHYLQSIATTTPFLGGQSRPFLQGGFTAYSQRRGADEAFRGLIEGGVNQAWKFGRSYSTSNSTNLIHYVEPRLSLIGRDVSLEPTHLYHYDRLDTLDSDLYLTFQLLNRLKVERQKEWFEALRLDLEADYSLKRGEPEKLRALALFEPRNNLTFRSEAEFDLNESKWETTSTALDWQRDFFRFGLTHTYQNGEEEVLAPYFSLPIGTKWRLSGQVSFNLLDDQMEGREVSVWRDLHCWEARFGVYKDREDTEFYLAFTLKAFPGSDLKIKSRLH